MNEPPTPTVKPGSTTSEYAIARAANTIGMIGLILGIIIAIGGGVLEAVELPGKWAAIVGAVVAGASAVQTALVSQGYIKSRTEVKVSADALAAKRPPQQ